MVVKHVDKEILLIIIGAILPNIGCDLAAGQVVQVSHIHGYKNDIVFI